ncbi:MAG: bifunctional serine/threonine-protein kinase/formylglycine-generating enzyme family protein [Thermodesulfobacteriota bacterium]
MNGTRKPPLLEPGITLNGKWEILEHLATGGKGEVYRAHQISLERDVVVKTISLEFLAEFSDPEEIETETQRFHREATAMAQVKHPHVAQVYDHDSALITRNGAEVTIQYLVMEYISGLTLRGTMTAEGFADNEDALINWIRQYFLPTLDGIAAVHELGIVHRDIKPENVLLDGSVPKITDFGIAGGIHWKPLTRSHHVEGTIQYMAPEQFTDLGETDARGDVYALGKILYEAIVGKMGRETACPLRGVCLASPQTDLLKQLDLLIQKATAEDVTQRIAAVKEFKAAIELCLPSPRTDLLNKLDLFVGKGTEEDKAERIAAVKEVKEAVEALADSGEFAVLGKRSESGWGRRHRKAIIAVVVLLVAGGFAGSHLYHHFVMVHDQPTPAQTVVVANGPKPALERPEGAPAAVTVEGHIPVTIKGPDGDCILHLIPEGEATLPESFGSKAGQAVKVPPFYIMEAPVTNADFVTFLNQILPELHVEQGTVRRGNDILVMLGEVMKGYEPIIFQDGKFSLKDEVFALRPVLRVTGYGASAYAQFYGERLPTELEWLRLIRADTSPTTTIAPEPVQAQTARENQNWTDGWMERERQQPVVSPENGNKVTDQRIESHVPSPVVLLQPDSYGIRGLGKSIGEWGLRITEDSSTRKREEKYIILGGVKGNSEDKSNELPVIARNPWEAFEEVGFRAVLTIKSR